MKSTIRSLVLLLTFFGTGVCLSGCQSAAVITATPGLKASATAELASPLPSPTQTPTIVPSPTRVVCSEEKGRIENSQAGSTSLVFRVYLPPCYDINGGYQTRTGYYLSENWRYPVLYMIHGQTYTDDQWDRLGIDEAADKLINNGDAPPFLIVMPLEADTLKDPRQSDFGRSVVESLVPWVDAHYKTCTLRLCRAIGGLSRGGAWAVDIGFSNWQLFNAIGAHSTPPFGDYPWTLPNWVRDMPEGEMPRVWMDIGYGDPYLKYALDFEKALTGYKVPHEWQQYPGGHTESYWESHVEMYLRWYVQPWKDAVSR